ncbi:MAG: hypothetical protein K2O32_11235 [Acetatifactor sp.]|nr:hypothetical protein [Acetatifactor sp.]
MFEQVTIPNKLKRRLGRAISIVMSVAMLVTALPADLLGGIMSVKAEEPAGTMVFDVGELVKAGALEAAASKDSKNLNDTKTVGDFTLTAENNHEMEVVSGAKESTPEMTIGTHTFAYRLNTRGKGQAKSNATSYRSISFTTSGAVTLRVYGTSNGSDDRAINLADAASEDSKHAYEVIESQKVTPDGSLLTFTKIEKAGTYYLYPDANLNIYRVEVIPVVETADDALYHTYDLSSGLSPDAAYDGGLSVLEAMSFKETDTATIGGEEFVGCVQGSGNPKDANNKNPEGASVPATGAVLKLDAEENGVWTVVAGKAAGKAVWCIEVAQGGGSNSGDDVYAGDADDATGSTSKSGITVLTNGKEVTAESAEIYRYNVKAGHTYYFYYNGSKAKIYSVTVDYRKSAPTAWSSVVAPTISKVEFSEEEATITVTATGAVDRIKGGDSLSVVMKDAENNEVTLTHTTDKSADVEQKFTFTPSKSGEYTFTAVLKREGEQDKTSEPKTCTADLNLKTPTIVNILNLGADAETGKGGLKVIWSSVPRAEAYKLAVYAESTDAFGEDGRKQGALLKELEIKPDETTKVLATEAKIDGLDVDQYVLVSVTASNAEGTSQAATQWVQVSAEGTAYFNLYMMDGLKKGIVYDGGFAVLEDMEFHKGTKSVGDKEYAFYVAGVTNPSPNKGKIPTIGAVLTLDAQKDGILRIYTSTTDKDLHLLDTLDGKVVSDLLMEEDSEDFFSFSPQTCNRIQVNVLAGHKYYFYGDGTKVNLHEVAVDYRSGEPCAWSEVPAPEVVSIEVDHTRDKTSNEPANKIKVGFRGHVDPFEGAECLRVDMLDEKGNIVASKTSYDYGSMEDTQYLTFTPTASGVYGFVANVMRSGEKDKASEKKVMEETFKLYLTMPEVSSVTNMGLGEDGKGSLEVVWDEVPEAVNYTVRIIDATDKTKKTEDLLKSGTVLNTGTTSELELVLGGLDVGKRVLVAVKAARAGENLADGDTSNEGSKVAYVKAEAGRRWKFSTWGSSIKTDKSNLSDISKSNDGYLENEDGSVRLWSTEGKGKIVPASTDGLAFYYTAIDPENENFELTADIHVNKWTMSNGQDGFGMMVSDAVGELGNGTAFWNNSYQLLATKVQYTWDTVNKTMTTGEDDTFARYTLKLGIGWFSKEGATQTDVANITNGVITKPAKFKTGSDTLETFAGEQNDMTGMPSGTYNIIGNAVSSTKYNSGEKYNSTDRADEIAKVYNKDSKGNPIPVSDIVEGTIAEFVNFKMSIRRNNDGYVLTYLKEKLDENGNVVKDESGNPVLEVIGRKVFYDDDRNNLTQIDKNNIYVGFVAARNADITVSNIEFKAIAPADDDPAAGREITEVRPNYQILSADTSNSKYYELVFRGNADGVLNVINKTDDGEIVAVNADITANKKYTVGLNLLLGENELEWSFTPDQDYKPSQYEKLSSYETVTNTFKVNYQILQGDKIYVAPNGKNEAGAGATAENPRDIYTAVQYAVAGQTIVLAKGTYNMVEIAKAVGMKTEILTIDRGHDGTEKTPIYMVAADDATGADRPVLDFTGQSVNKSAFTLAANYWYLKGFDVTRSKNGQKGLQVSGSYNVLEDMRTYKNGNTGIQIARYLGSDSRDEWPEYNTILNCSSYLNADDGYEDADGFAAKLTVGDGNKFVGCIAAYNADDGWDLFAKVETGSIGVVTIENCLAYKNGYLLGSVDAESKPLKPGVAGIDETLKTEFKAGNGNGFKMGGDSMSGYHVLKNSIAFGNRAKGIDSNSCPDIQVYRSTSFANESYNVALYTNTAVNTDYYAQGVLSIQKNGTVKDGVWVDGRTDDDGKAIQPDDDDIDLKGTQNKSKVYGALNYYWDGGVAENSAKQEASENWFVSVDMAGAIFGNDKQAKISRKADGSIDMHGFLELKASTAELVIPAGVGAVFGSTAADSVVEKKAEVSVYAGTVTTLGQVTLPAALKDQGYTWKYSDTLVSVFSGTTSEFIVSAEGKEDKAVIVNFVEVTGLELIADQESLIGVSTAESESNITLTAIPVTAPAVALDNVQGTASYTYTITESDRLKLNVAKAKGADGKEKDNEVIVTRAADSGEGLAKFTAAMSVTINNKTTRQQAVCTFTTRNSDYSFTYTLEGAEEKDNAIILNKVNDSFTLKDLKVNNVGSNTDVKVSTTDAKVIKVAGTTVTAAGEGTATLILTAAADKTVVKKISVTVRGAALKASVSTITIDKALKAGVQITVAASYGENIDGEVSVKSILKGKTTVDYAKYFDVKHLVGNIYVISVTDAGEAMPKGTYSMILQNTVTTGEGAAATTTSTEFEALTVKVIETKPTVTLRQTKKVNLFYTAGSEGSNGKLTANCKLAGVTLTQTDKDQSDYRLDGTAKTGYTIVLKQSAKDKLKRDLSKKITVDVSFDGYKAYCNKKNVSITVNTEERAPKLMLEVDDKVLYTKLGMNSTKLRVLDKATNMYVTGATVELTNASSNANFSLTKQSGAYVLSASRSGSAKLSIQDSDWKKPVLANQSITVNAGQPRVTFAVAKLNSTPEYAGLEQASALITLRNASTFNVTGLRLEGTNDKTNTLVDYLTCSVGTNELGQKVLLVSLKNQLPDGYRSGTYKLKAKFTMSNASGTVKLADQTADVKVSFAPLATVTTSQKGSIDLVNRSGSSVTVKPTLKNLNGTIVGMELKDDASNQFDVTWDSAKASAVIKAKEGIDLKKGGKYKVTPVFLVQTNGGVVEIQPNRMITITPKQSSVKTTTVLPLETRLSAPRVSAKTTVKAKSPAKAEILDMIQMNNTENFVVSYDAQSDTLTAKIIDTAGLKAGSTYRITMALEVQDSGVNVKKQTITVPVKVLN